MSLYWAIVTLTSIGYGDITPQNEIEYWMCLLFNGCMSGIFAYALGDLLAVISTL